MSDPSSELVLPIIALAEAVHIVGRGRTSVPSVGHLLRDVDSEPRMAVADLDRSVLTRSLQAHSVTEMHDRLIVATALELEASGRRVVLLTCDANITASGAVTVAW